MLRSGAVTLLVLSLVPVPAFAWGKHGHQIVALVAEAQVKDTTKTAIQKILGAKTLADVAPQPDELRAQEKHDPNIHPRTGQWHFVDIPFDAPAYVENRDCPTIANNEVDRNCVVAAIAHFQTVLANRNAPQSDRGRALTFLVHLIGDVHQPLHSTSRFTTDAQGKKHSDNGANGVTAEVPGIDTPQNLHGVWDDVLIAEERRTNADYAKHLLTDVVPTLAVKDVAETDVVAWANAAHQLAVKDAYDYDGAGASPTNAPLNVAYIKKNEQVADRQLALAGVHLAHVLDAALAP